MWPTIKQMYGGAVRFARAAPLLFLVPVLVEFAQHIAEIQSGLYVSRDAARAVANDPTRMAFGFAKTLALLLPGYWFTRYLAFGGDLRRTLAFDARALGLFAVQFAIAGSVQYAMLFGPSLGTLLGLDGRAASFVTAGLAVAQSVLGIYLTAWFVAWPIGNASLGPLPSCAVMAGSFWRAVGYLLAGVIPLMALHYAFGLGAIGRPAALVWAMLALDAITVGFLALTMTASKYVAARDAAERKQVSLFADDQPLPVPSFR
ncbi:hypothetical protein KZ810_02290 [Sphingomonas sp. RHCKR47]|uniref:hypothetical protein n=1 Tax=Sphingomonas citricola TaxID=2862498 RepID=UPI001CA47EE4|nr:hypothetical protein [Sphingomonas citricola]MBW6522316.1 hypothetical protein [Sphingomonas citricola]